MSDHLGEKLDLARDAVIDAARVIAAKGCTHAEYREGADFCARVLKKPIAFPSINPRHAGHMPRGGIVARARIVDVKPALGRKMTAQEWRAFWLTPSWHHPEQFGFVLEDVRPTPFVPCTGALGFWNVPTSVLDALRGAA